MASFYSRTWQQNGSISIEGKDERDISLVDTVFSIPQILTELQSDILFYMNSKIMHAVAYKYANRKWSLFAVIEVPVLVRIANQLAL